ncbi:MAG TPA: HAD family hydrolase [Candidatus Paceibacterota bacterium]|nr:HAD family hydrolase [Candidatus Paceibacterota bacterium]
MSIDVVLLDIEGCLTERKGKPIALEPLQVLQKAQSNVPFALCTGRPQAYAEAMIQILGLKAFQIPSIIENGCYLFDPAAHKLIPHPNIKGVEKGFLNLKKMLRAHMPEGKIEPGKELCISLIPTSDTEVERLYEKVRALVCAMPQVSDQITLAYSNSAVDITPRGIDKGRGAVFLCEYLDTWPDRILAIGDANNDRSVLSFASHVGCPSNATQEIKDLVSAKGGHVAKNSCCDGVIEILRYFEIIS